MEGEAAVEEDEGFHTVTAGNWSVFMYILILEKKLAFWKWEVWSNQFCSRINIYHKAFRYNNIMH